MHRPVSICFQKLVTRLIVTLHFPRIFKALLHKGLLFLPVDSDSAPVVAGGQVGDVVVGAVLASRFLSEALIEIVVEGPEDYSLIHILSSYQFVQTGLVNPLYEDSTACQFE